MNTMLVVDTIFCFALNQIKDNNSVWSSEDLSSYLCCRQATDVTDFIPTSIRYYFKLA